MSNLNVKEYKSFEDIKHCDGCGEEYWLARELTPVLEYVQWRNFQRVIDRAMLACKNSGFDVNDHFADVSKPIIGARELFKMYRIIDYLDMLAI